MPQDKPVHVTVPSLPPLADFTNILREVWESRILTHNGPIVQRLERELERYFHIRQLVAVCNGTVAIQLAIKALGLRGEIITTPFTYIATACAIQWEGCTPVFVDIDPETLNIDPEKIADAVTDKTVGILPVHVFSNPCDMESIADIAARHDLRVIYDAAHAMGVSYRGRSVLEYGDISATSFHSTKILNTAEGGACVTRDADLYHRLRRLRFFGHDEDREIVDVGCNGKMTEVHAALGLANLQHLDAVLRKRRAIYDQYAALLADVDFVRFQLFDVESYNYSYMPVILDSEDILLAIVSRLNSFNIYPRRYFYPSLSTVRALGACKPVENAEDISRRVLCLPSHNDVTPEAIEETARVFRG
jgi:dTDP-4-amino-4,6-dideoxygalactose transaminase